MAIKEPITIRKLLSTMQNEEVEMDTPVYVVPSTAVHDTYEGSDSEPSVDYDSNSWAEVHAIRVESEVYVSPSILLVYEADDDNETNV